MNTDKIRRPKSESRKGEQCACLINLRAEPPPQPNGLHSSVNLRLMYRCRDGGRDKKINRQTRLNPGANRRGRHVEGKSSQRPPAKRRWKNRCSTARAGHGHKLRELGQRRRLAPLVQLRGIVGADEIKQLRARKFIGIATQCVHGVGNAATLDFLFVRFAMGLACECQPEKFHTHGGGRGLGFRLERGLRRGNKKQRFPMVGSRAFS